MHQHFDNHLFLEMFRFYDHKWRNWSTNTSIYAAIAAWSEPLGSFNLIMDSNIRLSNLSLLKSIQLLSLKSILSLTNYHKFNRTLPSEVTTEDNYLAIICNCNWNIYIGHWIMNCIFSVSLPCLVQSNHEFKKIKFNKNEESRCKIPHGTWKIALISSNLV